MSFMARTQTKKSPYRSHFPPGVHRGRSPRQAAWSKKAMSYGRVRRWTEETTARRRFRPHCDSVAYGACDIANHTGVAPYGSGRGWAGVRSLPCRL